MKKNIFLFLLAPIAFAIFLLVFSDKAYAQELVAVRPSKCIATECGTTKGLRIVPVFEEVCDKGCPTIHFKWREKVYKSCPSGYSVRKGHIDQCKKNKRPNKGKIVDRDFHFETRRVAVLYDKSNDPNKCHRPSDHDLRVVYGMSHNVRLDFKKDNKEWIKGMILIVIKNK